MDEDTELYILTELEHKHFTGADKYLVQGFWWEFHCYIYCQNSLFS